MDRRGFLAAAVAALAATAMPERRTVPGCEAPERSLGKAPGLGMPYDRLGRPRRLLPRRPAKLYVDGGGDTYIFEPLLGDLAAWRK